jgi:pimeloyl-ACP methyl ester carboxylesterase
MSSNSIAFSERYIARGKARIYARDYAGVGPAFVLMHGFPDNLHIWDDLIPYLVASGRRVVAFDFLGFGSSDKPADAAYSFQQQLADLEAIVEGLSLGKIVPVAHDSSGMATLNYALTHPDGVDSAIMLNSAYSEDSTVLWPEMITLFATGSMQALAMAIAQQDRPGRRQGEDDAADGGKDQHAGHGATWAEVVEQKAAGNLRGGEAEEEGACKRAQGFGPDGQIAHQVQADGDVGGAEEMAGDIGSGQCRDDDQAPAVGEGALLGRPHRWEDVPLLVENCPAGFLGS